MLINIQGTKNSVPANSKIKFELFKSGSSVVFRSGKPEMATWYVSHDFGIATINNK